MLLVVCVLCSRRCWIMGNETWKTCYISRQRTKMFQTKLDNMRYCCYLCSGRSWMLGNETWKTGRRGRWGATCKLTSVWPRSVLLHSYLLHISTLSIYHVLFQCLTQICTASALFAMFFTPLDFLLNTCTIGTEFITTVVSRRLGDVLGSKREGTLLMFRNINSLFKAEMT